MKDEATDACFDCREGDGDGIAAVRAAKRSAEPLFDRVCELFGSNSCRAGLARRCDLIDASELERTRVRLGDGETGSGLSLATKASNRESQAVAGECSGVDIGDSSNDGDL